MDAMTSLLDALDPLLPSLEADYQDLHAHPELAFQEKRTAALVAERLSAQGGWEVTTGVGRTGVVGVLANGEGPVVMLRADMDALPVKEATGLPYASTVTATDDSGTEVPVMHACGHDLHVAALLGACALFAAHTDRWKGTVVAVFQPGEESGYGARAMVDDGLFERFPRPDIILGQHVGPGPVGLIATCPGTVMGATDSITVRLFGRGGHGSKPESAVDPVVMAASLVLRLQTIASREISAQEPVVVTVGKLHAGTTAAVIPDTAELGINVRTSSEPVREKVLAAIERLAKAESAAAGATADPEITSVYHLPMTVNDKECAERVADAHRRAFGEGAVLTMGPTTASEDFGILATAAQVPSVYWFYGGLDPEVFTAAFAAGRVDEDIPQNHSSTFAPLAGPALAVGAKSMAAAALSWLGGGPAGVPAAGPAAGEVA
ncbi:amidohydrolase [Streptomyces sp. FIT100]|uniref:amidohydrolase n=1 Tax=Streptomyces sp. FIT100 TaxID=2837956 RepID=UPI0021C8559B|nr:amidohydrolase [Streptomyces sp. FIT100]UUN30746.1 amidohydrolase [Streptomyces sp. FIT100]